MATPSSAAALLSAHPLFVMRSKGIRSPLIAMFIFALSVGDASELKTEDNNTRNQIETYMLAYVVGQHVLRSDENKSKEVLVGIGDYVDGNLISPDVKVLKDLKKMFPNVGIEALRFVEGSKKKVERKADEVIVTVEIITYSHSVVGKEKTMSAVVEVHCNYGPLNGFGEAYHVAYYDEMWAIHLLRQIYVS